MSQTRGFTLIELMISVTIMLVAVAVAAAVMITGTNVAHKSEMWADQADFSRAALGELVKNVQLAGNGAPGGVYMNFPTGAPQLYSAAFGIDGRTGTGGSGAPVNPTGDHVWETDDLWVVVPMSGAMKEPCVDRGAGSMLLTSGSDIKVRCNAGTTLADSFSQFDTLLVSNMRTAALVDVTAVHDSSTPPSLDYSESSVTGFTNTPGQSGFKAGDLVYGANLYHYYVRNDADGVPGLYRARGVLNSGTPQGTSYPSATDSYPSQGRPLVDAIVSGAPAATLIQRNVEDLQIAYGIDRSGIGDPSQFDWVNGLAPAHTGDAVNLRAVRISVVVRSDKPLLDNQGHKILSDSNRPAAIENHYSDATDVAPDPDGYRRMIYTRTVELPNLAPGSL